MSLLHLLLLVTASGLVHSLNNEAGKALLRGKTQLSSGAEYGRNTGRNNTGRNHTQRNDTQRNDTQRNHTQRNDTQRNNTQRAKVGYQHPILQYATTVVIQASLGNQTLALMPDTGSFDLLISSVLCERCKSKKYRGTESKSFYIGSPMEKKTFHFGIGDVSALRAYDAFAAGPLRVSRMPLWLISDITPGLYSSFGTSEFDGLLGLGLSRSSASEEMGVNSFSFCLHTFVSSWFSGGFLHWNGRDEANFQWSAPVKSVSDFHWQVKPEQVKFGTHELCKGGCSAVMDSGTSILAAPSSASWELEKALPEVPANCSLEGLPSLTFLIEGGEKLVLPPSAYVIKVNGNYDVFDDMVLDGAIVWRRPSANTTSMEGAQPCAPMFQITKSGHWILGMPFFREYAVHFDRQQKAMSFAANKGGTCGPGTSFHSHQGYNPTPGIVEVNSSELFEALKRRS